LACPGTWPFWLHRCCEQECYLAWMTRNTRPSTEHYFRVRWNRHVTSMAHSDLPNLIAVGNDCYIHWVEPYSRWWSLNQSRTFLHTAHYSLNKNTLFGSNVNQKNIFKNHFNIILPSTIISLQQTYGEHDEHFPSSSDGLCWHSQSPLLYLVLWYRFVFCWHGHEFFVRPVYGQRYTQQNLINAVWQHKLPHSRIRTEQNGKE
jgi:hypothetical protein